MPGQTRLTIFLELLRSSSLSSLNSIHLINTSQLLPSYFLHATLQLLLKAKHCISQKDTEASDGLIKFPADRNLDVVVTRIR